MALLLYIYRYFYTKNELFGYKNTNKLKWIFSLVLFEISRYLFNVTLKLQEIFGFDVRHLDDSSSFVVSLTSFPARIGKIWITIESIYRQTVKPKRILLFLSKSEFPNATIDLPLNIKRYMSRGLKVVFVEDNLMPHKKYLYAFKMVLEGTADYNEVITIDDDEFYMPDTIERLMNLHMEFPNAVCANKVRRIRLNKDYQEWNYVYEKQSPRHNLLPIGVGGVLYPARCFKDMRMYDVELIKQLCLRADDLWLKAFEIINNIPVVSGDYEKPSIDILGSQSFSLMATNTSNQASINNNTQWKAIVEVLNIELDSVL